VLWVLFLVSIGAWWLIARARRERDVAVSVLVQSASEQAQEAEYHRRLAVAAREAKSTASLLGTETRLDSYGAAESAAAAERKAAVLAYEKERDDTPARKLLRDYQVHCYEVARGPVHYRRKQEEGMGTCSLCRAMNPEDVRKAVRFHEAYQALKAVDSQAALEMLKSKYQADRDARRKRLGAAADDAVAQWWDIYTIADDQATSHHEGWCPASDSRLKELESKYAVAAEALKSGSWTPPQILEISEAQTETRLRLNELKSAVEREFAKLGPAAFRAEQAWVAVYHSDPDDRRQLITEAERCETVARETSTPEQVETVLKVRRLAERSIALEDGEPESS
jgi:hypothetical protein